MTYISYKHKQSSSVLSAQKIRINSRREGRFPSCVITKKENPIELLRCVPAFFAIRPLNAQKRPNDLFFLLRFLSRGAQKVEEKVVQAESCVAAVEQLESDVLMYAREAGLSLCLRGALLHEALKYCR